MGVARGSTANCVRAYATVGLMKYVLSLLLALAAPPEIARLSLFGVLNTENTLVPLWRISALPTKTSRTANAKTGNTPTNPPSQIRDARSANNRPKTKIGK